MSDSLSAPSSAKHRKRRARPRRGRSFPAPGWSARRYVRVARKDVALFRFLLEAWDNLALFTVVDRTANVLLLRYSPHQERELGEFLDAARELIPVETVYRPEGR